MIEDELLTTLGMKLLVQVHDEIIVESSLENAKQVSERMRDLMIKCCEDKISVPMKVKPDIFLQWNGERVIL